MSALRRARTRWELLLLTVSVSAAAIVVTTVARTAPPTPALWGATAAALALSVTAAFAFWFAGATRRALRDATRREHDLLRGLLAAVPEGLLVVGDGRVLSVNRRLCELLGYRRVELVGAPAPFPFWPPEHRHEIERWHDTLADGEELAAELVFSRRDGDRIPVLVAGSALATEDEPRYVLTVRDISASHRREQRLAELSSRDPQTGLLNERGFEECLRESVRQAVATGGNVAVALLELRTEAPGALGVLGTPDGLLAAERLQAVVRAGEAVARIRADELAWILPGSDAEGAAKAVARAREELAEIAGIVVTAGISDLATAGDVPSLYALADRALAGANRKSGDHREDTSEDVDDLSSTLVG